MMVVAILAIALAFCYPAISDMIHRAPMAQGVKDVLDLCQNARSQAILTGQPMELRIYPQEMRLEVAVAPADVVPGSTSPASSGDEAPTVRATTHIKNPYIHSSQLPDQLRLEMVDVNFLEYKDSDLARVRFYPNGTCDEMTIVLHSDLDWRKISLEVVTSLPSVETVQ